MKQIAAAALVALAASGAHAASISVDVAYPGWTGEDIPGPGQTIILTITATANSGETDSGVYGELHFNQSIQFDSLEQTALQSFDGALSWVIGGASGCLTSTQCTVFSQLGSSPGAPIPVTNTPLVIATLTFTLTSVGELYASWDDPSFQFFGAATPPDVCIVGVGCPVIPEPSTAALLALGLIGLATAPRWRG